MRNQIPTTRKQQTLISIAPKVLLNFFVVYVYMLGSNSSAGSDTGIRKDLESFYDRYANTFMVGDIELMTDKILLPPLFFVVDDQPSVLLNNKKEVRKSLDILYSQLKAENYDRSEIASKKICLISDTSAIINVSFRRLAKDKSVISKSFAAYSLVKHEDSWRFILISIQSKDPNISC